MLLNTITLASSASAPSALNPVPITSATPSLHSPSSTLVPLSNSLSLCHCNLVSALTNVLSTSFQLLTLSTLTHSFTPHSYCIPPLPTHPPSSSSSASPLPTPSISVPPRFTIRVVSDLRTHHTTRIQIQLPITLPCFLPSTLCTHLPDIPPPHSHRSCSLGCTYH